MNDRTPQIRRAATLIYYLEFCIVRSLLALLNCFPPRLSERMAEIIGDIFCLVVPRRKHIALKNLDMAYGDSLSAAEKNKLARDSIRSFVKAVVEAARVPTMLCQSKGRVEFEGIEYLEAALQKNRGVISPISHLGSWEYLAFLPYLRGYCCSVIVRPVRNPYLYQWIQNLRTQTRLWPIDREQSIRPVLRELKQNHVVGILIDQWAGPEGVWGNFFGKPTSTTSLPARLARKTGAALIPMYCLRMGSGRYRICIKPEVPVHAEQEDYETSVTLQLNELLEKEIRAHPEQWIWSHRRWKDFSRYRNMSMGPSSFGWPAGVR